MTLIPAALITGPHISVSDLSCAASSAGVEPMAMTPTCSSLLLIAGSRRIAIVSACSFLTISAGVLTGTRNAYHDETSKPGTKSATVGNSGAVGKRLAVVTASPRNCPDLACCSTPAMVLNMTSTRPGMTSFKASATPR